MRIRTRSFFLHGIVFLASLFAFGISARSQTTAPTPAPTPSLEREFFKNILRDQKAIWLAPTHLEKSDAKWLVPASIGFMALATTDRITGDEFAEFDRLKPSQILSYPGSTYAVAAVAGSFYLIGRKKDNSRARETGILSAEAAIDSLIVVSALKGISQRARPESGIERSEFFDGGDSFPSGHSIQAWTVATVVANEYHDKPVVQIAAYGLASAVSVARVTVGKHYISDVLVGSALGFGIGRYVYRAHHRKAPVSTDDSDAEEVVHSRWPAIIPSLNRQEHSFGISFLWNF